MVMLHSRKLGVLTVGIGAIVTLAATEMPAYGQDEEKIEYLQNLKNCQAIVPDAERLACFDQAVQLLVAASEQGNLQVVDRAEVRETRRKFFGLSLPDLGIFKKRSDQDTEELEVLQSTIANASRTNDGWIIETAEGALWRIDNVPARLLSPKVGQPIEFRKASLGSYFVGINNQLGVKGRRIR